ncbi:MAG: DUF4340 domain-containing protein [Sedimenticola sp.]
MSRRTLINLGLMVVVLILGALTWYSSEENSEEQFQPLTALNPSEINRITISNNNGPEFTLERDDTGWSMTDPYRMPANGPRINILLDIVSTPSFEQHPVPAERLGEFGLDKPRAEMLLNDHKLVFGGTHPYNYRRYVQIGDTLHLTNDHFPHHFLALAEEFISHSLLGEGQQVAAIETSSWKLLRSDQGWQLQPPVDGLLTDQLVSKVNDWENTWVTKVEKAPTLAATDSVTISFRDASEPLVLEVVKTETALLLVRRESGLAYRLPLQSTLLQPPAPQN